MRKITPLMLMPMSEWQMKPCHGEASHLVGIGIYAQPTADGGYCRTWHKWPWSCLPNNMIGVDDLIRCGVMDAYLAWLDRQDERFKALERQITQSR